VGNARTPHTTSEREQLAADIEDLADETICRAKWTGCLEVAGTISWDDNA